MKDYRKSSDAQEKITPGQIIKTHWHVLKDLLKNHKSASLSIFFFSAIIAILNIVDLKFLEHITNQAAKYINTRTPKDFYELFVIICFFILSIILLKAVSWLYSIVSTKYNNKVSMYIECQINKCLSNIAYENYESSVFFDKINLAKGASDQYSKAIFGLTEFIKIVVSIVIYGILLSKVSKLYLFIILISISVSIILSTIVTDYQLRFWKEHVSPEARRCNYFKKIIGNKTNHQNIKLFRAFDFFSSKFDTYNGKEQRNCLKLNILSFLTELMSSVFFLITFVCTAIVITQGIVSGEHQIGYYSMTIALLTSLFTSIKSFSVFIFNNTWYVKVIEAYLEIINMNDNKVNRTGFASQKTGIYLKNVTYTYPQSNLTALNNISVSFPLGQKIAIVGHNGSGKTTLVNIIMDLLCNFTGELSVDTVSTSAILQDFCQYQMTIKQNIEIGNAGKPLPEDQIYDILKKVDMYEYVTQLPAGINTSLGQLDRGVGLSKGQWQRLAIGRLLANPTANVWILDEPTAHLDPLSEIEIYKLILSLAENRLVFFISHRLGFAKNADRIIVVDGGRIVEDGNHQELLRNKESIYFKMYTAQKEHYT